MSDKNIEVLQTHLDHWKRLLAEGICDKTEGEETVEAFQAAIKALEKEIPKPINIENGFVKCGGCGIYIRFPIADCYNNCPECGQKILWKGDTE